MLRVSGAKEWIGTELTFDLRETDGSTVLLFAQRGWQEQGEFMHYCSTKWGTYLVGLKSLVKAAQVLPTRTMLKLGSAGDAYSWRNCWTVGRDIVRPRNPVAIRR